MDEILGVIIDSEGMSFNDLKPIYKEFLLKLSVTLTKDELYQRSKSIMRRQKKKLMTRRTKMKKKNSHVVICGKFKNLKHIFQRMKLNRRHRKHRSHLVKSCTPSESKIPESSLSSSSFDTRQFRPKDNHQIVRKQSYKKRVNEVKPTRRKDRTSTSEESDFFSVRRAKAKHQNIDGRNHNNRNSSSGYVSYSECSYDSDTCTCTSADKCYCSLGQKNTRKKYKNGNGLKNGKERCYCGIEKTPGMYFLAEVIVRFSFNFSFDTLFHYLKLEHFF